MGNEDLWYQLSSNVPPGSSDFALDFSTVVVNTGYHLDLDSPGSQTSQDICEEVCKIGFEVCKHIPSVWVAQSYGLGS